MKILFVFADKGKSFFSTVQIFRTKTLNSGKKRGQAVTFSPLIGCFDVTLHAFTGTYNPPFTDLSCRKSST